MKRTILTAITLLIHVSLFSQSLKVSQNGRFIEKENGSPFLWIGDTAWELFHKLNREEADEYLTKRKKQGFTLIQAVVLAENDGLRTPNSYGATPLVDLNPENPNESYFEHVDYIVNKANDLGLVVGMLPTWGDKVFSLHPGTGPVVFNDKNAEKYGEYLGNRYKENNIIWILGGDRDVANEEVLGIWRSMAKGIKSGDNGSHLTTYHPRGGSSSSYSLHNETWLDFNMYQSGHGQKFNPVYDWAETDYLKNPTKPFVDGEPAYEGISVKFWEFCDFSTTQKVPSEILDKYGIIKDSTHFKKGFFTDYDVRIHAYWNILSGACGYTYGNNAVWQMFKKGGDISIPCTADWRESLNHNGANQLIHLKKLFESHSIANLLPDLSIIYGLNPKNAQHIRAAKSTKGQWVIVYLAKGQQVNVVMSKILDDTITAYWYNPRDGNVTAIGEFSNKGIKEFSPPSMGENNDWILVLDSKNAKIKILKNQ